MSREWRKVLLGVKKIKKGTSKFMMRKLNILYFIYLSVANRYRFMREVGTTDACTQGE